MLTSSRNFYILLFGIIFDGLRATQSFLSWSFFHYSSSTHSSRQGKIGIISFLTLPLSLLSIDSRNFLMISESSHTSIASRSGPCASSTSAELLPTARPLTDISFWLVTVKLSTPLPSKFSHSANSEETKSSWKSLMMNSLTIM